MSQTQPKVSKIAILNPYLLRDIVECSEVEASHRFIAAAKNLGIHAEVFSHSDDIDDFQPDFVVPISHQEPKLTRYPTYGLLTNPLKWALGSHRYARNIFTYDGYFVACPHVLTWLKDICQRVNKTLHHTNAAFSVPKTEFKLLDYKNAVAGYMGLNWDGLRHFELFNYLAEGDFIKCFGPEDSWAKYPSHIYGGMVPFDGFSALKAYGDCGAGIGINHPDMDNEGIPTCRTFEISASSAVAICAKNSYIVNNYRDSVLYVDKNLPTPELAEAIKEKIMWIRNNPEQAAEMAKSAHDIFNQQLSLEFFIGNMVKMHQEILKDREFIKAKEDFAFPSKPKITYLIPVDNTENVILTLDDLKQQTYSNIDIILLANSPKLESQLSNLSNNHITVMTYTDASCNKRLFEILSANGSEWLGILKAGDRLFQNHCALLMKTYKNSTHDRNKESTAIIFSSSLEHSNVSELRDKIQDGCMLYFNSKSRVGNITPCSEIHLCSVLFKLKPGLVNAFSSIDFTTNLRVKISIAPLDAVIHVNEITCSSSMIDEKKLSALIIENATTLLNFTNNYTYAQGVLLLDERQRRKLATV